MKRPLPLLLLFAFGLALTGWSQETPAPASPVSTQKSPTDRMKAIYKVKLQSAYDAYNTGLTELRVKYVSNLQMLESHYQNGGVLESLLACKKELTRFDAEMSVQKGDVVKGPAELTRAQSVYVDVVTREKNNYAQTVLDLTKGYIAGLEHYVIEYTKVERFEEALAARVESKVTAKSDLVMWAASLKSDLFFLQGILEAPTPEQYPTVLEIVSKDIAVHSTGLPLRRKGKASIYVKGEQKLADTDQGINVYAMTPLGKPLLNASYNRDSEEDFANALNELDNGSIVVFAVQDFMYASFKSNAVSLVRSIGGNSLMDTPKGGAYYCIGVKGLTPGNAIEDHNEQQAAYPNLSAIEALQAPVRKKTAAVPTPKPKPVVRAGVVPSPPVPDRTGFRRSVRGKTGFRGLDRAGQQQNK